MDGLLRDLRFALRGLQRTPGFAALAVLAMALGVAAVATLYALVDAMLLRPLPLPKSDELVRVYEIDPQGKPSSLSPANYFDFAGQVPSLADMAAFRLRTLNLVTAQGPERVPMATVSANFFAALQVRPALGRDFLPSENDEPNAARAILTDGAWRRRFGARPEVLGQTLTVDGKAYTVVGVLPRGFVFPLLREAEAYVPFGFDADDRKNRGGHALYAIARRAPGASLERVNRDLSLLAGRLAADHPESNAHYGARAEALRDDIGSDAREPLTLALAAAGLVLLLACANVGGMLLARGAAREQELAIRAALGGGRLRLVRQLLTESALIGLAGGALGLLFAGWGLDALLASAPRDTPRLDEVHLDPRTCLLAMGVALVAGLLAGLAPALQVKPGALAETLRAGPSSTGSARKARARRALVVTQLALALTLTASATLMAESVRRALSARLGLDARGVLVLELSFPRDRFHTSAEASALNGRLLDRIAAIPGVQAAASANSVPLTGSWTIAYELADRPPPLPGDRLDADLLWVSTDFCKTLRIPLQQGRDFARTDTPQSLPVALVNEAFARREFPGESPIGKRVRVFAALYDKSDRREWTIAGVTADVRQEGADKEPQPTIYLPESQQGNAGMHLLVRSDLPPAQLAVAVRAELSAIAPEQPLGKVRPLATVAAESVGGRSAQAVLFAGAALVSLLLAALGVYGLVAWTVAQRTRELGVRLALGAQPGQLLRMVVVDGLKLALTGLALGVLGALSAGRVLQASLYGTSATDPRVYLAVAALLAAVTALASLLPARRAARTSPLTALKAE